MHCFATSPAITLFPESRPQSNWNVLQVVDLKAKPGLNTNYKAQADTQSKFAFFYKFYILKT